MEKTFIDSHLIGFRKTWCFWWWNWLKASIFICATYYSGNL